MLSRMNRYLFLPQIPVIWTFKCIWSAGHDLHQQLNFQLQEIIKSGISMWKNIELVFFRCDCCVYYSYERTRAPMKALKFFLNFSPSLWWDLGIISLDFTKHDKYIKKELIEGKLSCPMNFEIFEYRCYLPMITGTWPFDYGIFSHLYSPFGLLSWL